MVSDDFEAQANRVFENLKAVAKASGGTLDNAVKLTIFLTDLGNFPTVNEVMAAHMNEPYPARAAVEVSALPKGAKIEPEGCQEGAKERLTCIKKIHKKSMFEKVPSGGVHKLRGSPFRDPKSI